MMATMRDYERQVVDEEDACYVGKNEDNEGDMQQQQDRDDDNGNENEGQWCEACATKRSVCIWYSECADNWNFDC